MNAQQFRQYFEQKKCWIYKTQEHVDQRGEYVTWCIRSESTGKEFVCVHVRQNGYIRDATIAKACLGLGISIPPHLSDALEEIQKMDQRLNSV